MAGLEAFLRRDHIASRQAAQAIKLPSTKRAIDSPKLPPPLVPRQQTPPAQRELFESSIVDSDFDITRSEVEVDEGQYIADQYDDELEHQDWNYGGMNPEAPHIIPSVAQTPSQTKRTGRFDSGFPIRGSRIEPQNDKPKKRTHSRRGSQFATTANYVEQSRLNGDDDGYQESTSGTSQSEPEQQGDDTLHAGLSMDNFDGSSLDDTTIELLPRDNKKGAGILLQTLPKHTSPIYQGDYSDKELRGMSYSNLREEVFETDSHPPQPDIPRHLQGPNITLSDRISYFVDSRNTDAQALFFGRMTMEEWEQTGEWFMERFGTILQDFGKARRNKRVLAAKFEEEIGAREKAVRGKINGINRELDEMQNGGEMVLRGKSV
ncbi:hypothetical protein B7463_g531, partial [Scytalidium lignicola]